MTSLYLYFNIIEMSNRCSYSRLIFVSDENVIPIFKALANPYNSIVVKFLNTKNPLSP